jgi:hypothetical protein
VFETGPTSVYFASGDPLLANLAAFFLYQSVILPTPFLDDITAAFLLAELLDRIFSAVLSS